MPTNTATQIMNSFQAKPKPRIFMKYARYKGDEVIAFDDGKNEIYLDTDAVIQNFSVFDTPQGSKMSISDGTQTITCEYKNDHFIEATQQEFLEYQNL